MSDRQISTIDTDIEDDTQHDQVSTIQQTRPELYESTDIIPPQTYLTVNPPEAVKELIRQELQIFQRHHNISLKDADINEETCIDDVFNTACDLASNIANNSPIGGKAFLRICLRRTLYLKYKITFEIDDIPNKRTTKFPRENEQQNRHNNLLNGQKAAAQCVTAQNHIVNATKNMVALRTPSAIFCRDKTREVGTEQISDLAVNYLFWLLDEEKDLTTTEKLIIYLAIFGEDTLEEVYDFINKIGEKDKNIYMETVADVENIYAKVKAIIEEKAAQFIKKFCEKEKFNDSSGLTVMTAKKTTKRTKTEQTKESNMYKPETFLSRHLNQIHIPQTVLERFYDSRYALMAKHGNNTARINMMFLYLQYAISVSNRMFRNCQKKYDPHKKPDNDQETAMRLAHVVPFFDIRFRCAPSTYYTQWAQQIGSRHAHNNDVIRMPVHVHDLLMLINKNKNIPPAELRVILEKTHTGEFIDKLLDGTLDRKVVSFNAKVAKRTTHETSESELIDNFSLVEENTIIDDLNDKERSTKIIAVISLLPPYAATFLRLYYGIGEGQEKLTLQEIGDFLGITRERVRQVLLTITTRLAKPTANNILIKSFILKNRAKFLAYCEKIQLTPNEIIDLELRLGIKEDRPFIQKQPTRKKYHNQHGTHPENIDKVERAKKEIQTGMANKDPEFDFIEIYDSRTAYQYARLLLSKIPEKDYPGKNGGNFNTIYAEAIKVLNLPDGGLQQPAA